MSQCPVCKKRCAGAIIVQIPHIKCGRYKGEFESLGPMCGNCGYLLQWALDLPEEMKVIDVRELNLSHPNNFAGNS